MNQPAQTLTFKLPPKTLRTLALWTAGGIAIFWLFSFLPAMRSVFSIVIFALFLAFILDPVVNFLENRGISRLLAAVLVFALIIFLGVVGFKFLAPVVSNEIQQMSSGMNDQSAGDFMQKLRDKLGDDIPLLSNPMVEKELKAKVDEILKRSFSVVVNLLSAVVSMIMLAFITFFFLKDGRAMKKRLISWVPNRYFEMALIILHKTSTQLGRYIRGQLLVAFIVGALSIMALYLLHIRYAFFIGALAGMANMIPYFGPLVGAVPAIVIALIDTGDLGAVVTVAVAFASIQLFENVFVSPFIVSKSVELHPLTIIIAILIGAQLMGIFGMLLAVPTASIIKVTTKELAWGFKNYRIFS